MPQISRDLAGYFEIYPQLRNHCSSIIPSQVWAQPTRDDVTVQRRLSLTKPIPRLFQVMSRRADAFLKTKTISEKLRWVSELETQHFFVIRNICVLSERQHFVIFRFANVAQSASDSSKENISQIFIITLLMQVDDKTCSIHVLEKWTYIENIPNRT